MIFIWGEKLYRRVHQVPGVCYVETVFFHAFFFPLFPYRSYIVVSGSSPEIEDAIDRGEIRQSSYGFWGIRIPLSPLSVVMGYLRGILGLVAFLFGDAEVFFPFFADPKHADPKHHGLGSPENLMFTGIAIGSAALFVVSRYLTVASETKADELMAQIGVLLADELEPDDELGTAADDGTM